MSTPPPEPRLPRPPGASGVGLRVQILVALGVAFGLTVLLLGLTTARLGARAIDVDRAQGTRAVAFAIAEIDDPGAQHRALERLLESEAVLGAELVTGETTFVFGEARGATEVEVTLGERTVRIYLASAQNDSQRSLPGLLFLYVGVTAAAVLLLVYVLLTRSIVRPVEALTRAAAKLGRGDDARVPVRGAAEVAGLARTFNEMQTQLALEREALKRRLEELERTTRELESTQVSLLRSEKMASVGRLAAGVAHEIGNPLSAILGLVELVEAGDLEPDEQREFLRRVRKETERISHIIRDLLDFARAEPIADEPSACDLVEVVEDAVRLVGPQKDLRQVTLERRFAPDCPPVRAEAARLSQVVLNLLLNAADAIDGEGTIVLEVQPAAEGFVRLTVADTGPGIPDEVVDHLFEPFVTTKPTGEGTGLGLAVSHTLIEHYGGTLTADNPPEGGARFVVRLPAA